MSDDDLNVTVIVEEDVIVEEGDLEGSPVMIPIGLRQVVSPISETSLPTNSYLIGASSSVTMPTSTQFQVPTNTTLTLDLGIYLGNESASVGWKYSIKGTGVTLSSTSGVPSGTPVTVTTPGTTGTPCSITVTFTNTSNTTFVGNMSFST